MPATPPVHGHGHDPGVHSHSPRHFWRVPTPIKTWGKVKQEEEAHVQWMDLFFDLLFVGVAYLVGHQLEHGLHRHGHGDAGLVAAVATSTSQALCTYVIVVVPWFGNMEYYARFDVQDLVHKLIDMIEYCVIGVAALHIGGVGHHQHALSGLAVWCGIACGIRILRYLELALWSKHSNARWHAGGMVLFESVQLISTLGLRWLGGDLSSAMFVQLLAGAAFLPRAAIIVRVLFRIMLSPATLVPFHISFVTHRVGEFMMLMLGE